MQPQNRNEWLLIGISGVTCGGKTTLANKLSKVFTPSYVFHQDLYFYPDDSPRHVKCHGLAHNNYDILSALDMQRMYNDILDTMKGFDKSHDKNVEHDKDSLFIKGKKIMIVEGFTALNYKPILELCDLRYYIVLEYAECVNRRTLRLYEPPDVAGYFEQCVWPEHLRYKAEMERDRRVRILEGNEPDIFFHVKDEVLRHGGAGHAANK